MYENEEWRPIIIECNGIIYDYSGFYEVSNMGRVRSLIDNHGKYREKILKPVENNQYLYIGLKHKKFSVHRLVATAFIPNPDNFPVVNHKDENKHNNCMDNLEWCTVKYNSNYGTCQKRRNEKIKGEKHPNARKILCVETGEVFGCIKDAEKWLGKTGICDCLKGRLKTAGGYHWAYCSD